MTNRVAMGERGGQGRHRRAAGGRVGVAGPAAVPGQGSRGGRSRIPCRTRRRPRRVVAVRARPEPYLVAVDILIGPVPHRHGWNALDLYDTIDWWDDANHLNTWFLHTAAIGLLRPSGPPAPARAGIAVAWAAPRRSCGARGVHRVRARVRRGADGLRGHASGTGPSGCSAGRSRRSRPPAWPREETDAATVEANSPTA